MFFQTGFAKYELPFVSQRFLFETSFAVWDATYHILNDASLNQVLRQLTSVVNYGGRITDDKDMRTSDIIIAGFYNPEILSRGFTFSRSGRWHMGFHPISSQLFSFNLKEPVSSCFSHMRSGIPGVGLYKR